MSRQSRRPSVAPYAGQERGNAAPRSHAPPGYDGVKVGYLATIRTGILSFSQRPSVVGVRQKGRHADSLSSLEVAERE
jgi:hypothetical protein